MKRTILALSAVVLLLSISTRSYADNLLTTEDFENNRVTMDQATDGQLQDFLGDLQGRRDYDAQCHNGNPGPDADYLNSWIDKTTVVLKARGFKFDENGNPKQQ